MNRSMPGFPVLKYSLELAQTHVHWVSDTIQLSHPLSYPSLLALNLSQHQSLFQWVGCLHHVAKVLEYKLLFIILFYYSTLLILYLFYNSPHRFQYLPSQNTCIWGELGFPGGSTIKNPPANAVDSGVSSLVPGSGRSPGIGNGNPLQYSCLENSTDSGAWRATAHGVTKSRTWLSIHASK